MHRPVLFTERIPASRENFSRFFSPLNRHLDPKLSADKNQPLFRIEILRAGLSRRTDKNRESGHFRCWFTNHRHAGHGDLAGYKKKGNEMKEIKKGGVLLSR